ncbi:hypothetical protein DJ93_5060 [Bacillus clarus]|uniref:Uncharacterized protein n=1 Tax=Bacillus clarus TaxID=2338372 RepID=A0A090ZDC7_9BACI|nr:hypothetical protein DJ93_5060 [Bacillus clarus]
MKFSLNSIRLNSLRFYGRLPQKFITAISIYKSGKNICL